ncbi:MAG: ferritin family protein [Nitrospirota bacterium]
MIKFSIREVVEQAVQTEKLGEEFYRKMAEKFHNNNELKKLFELLATHEVKHGKSFAELRNTLADQEPEGWDEVALYLKAIVDSEFFLGKDKCLPSMEHVQTAAQAVEFALCFERETLLYYYALRETTREKTILDRIIREERSHIVWLNNLKQNLT